MLNSSYSSETCSDHVHNILSQDLRENACIEKHWVEYVQDYSILRIKVKHSQFFDLERISHIKNWEFQQTFSL